MGFIDVLDGWVRGFVRQAQRNYSPARVLLERPTVTLCRADKVLLAGGTAVLGCAALLTATPLAVGAGAAFLAVLTDGIFRPSSSVLYPTISRGPRTLPQVALTFDDGPDPEVTPLVLDALGRSGARATFFVIGRHLERHTAIAARAVAEGHELGNHSWMHSYFQNFYRTGQHRADVERSTRLIQQLSGTTTEPLYRAPVGLKSPPLARVAHARKLTVIAWSLHSRDTMTRDHKSIVARVLSRVGPGDIVLMHDGHERDGEHRHRGAAALPLILSGLQARGLRCVTVSNLLGF
jgi:peptidoglycan-N-acetylglucosamine deacetylase